ncbi:related to Spore wall maturation protein DIT1 [Saccharomycodes ludwigii]|uniref:Related to Spore wall maturation protein DIT1 n=1 Tax=Saccharomycodes ludwigii TaxID=36035 RepID=A0A376B620_9ASCO|nr:hypothetical protein SCDLUD_003272 [Saccharomycodes ludwigii]KAH3900300.1 hypothetical protein SCDLUD_003272 [Saccharomycodes ludwigii]SSD60123.1 related to Spore wall maturation protein DIT1 [Saccharomycodes ludwigii]
MTINNKIETSNDYGILHGGENSKDMSTFSKFLCIYSRNPNTFELYEARDKQNSTFGPNWDEFKMILQKNVLKATEYEYGEVYEYIIPVSAFADTSFSLNGNIAKFIRFPTNNIDFEIKVSEYWKAGESQIRGVITTTENENVFNDWFVFHILDQARLHTSETPMDPTISTNYAELFTRFFEENLKNTVVQDEWDLGGRQHFLERVEYFTKRMAKIECILPAFPCKSSNTQKVYSLFPDMGEELAFKNLISCVEKVSKIYPPGIKIWIVSDGHVFSDCIGVDDDVVDEYTRKLHNLYKTCAVPGIDAIGFCGLKELFFEGDTSLKFNEEWVAEITLPHYTGSKICQGSELCRKILMKGCDTDDGRLREQILIPDHPRLHLYRGFSKFMIEDLRLLSHFKGASNKTYKKTACKVSFEMIKRNDAYSNLVDLVFPHHLRLSIHAHNNRGPKFGIRIISLEQCRPIKSLNSVEEPEYEDLLHIPTPWHNCVVKVDNNDKYYLTRSSVIHEAISKGLYKGEWCIEHSTGGHFVIRKVDNELEKDAAIVKVSDLNISNDDNSISSFEDEQNEKKLQEKGEEEEEGDLVLNSSITA